jgi:hypothetical protein
VSDAPTEVVSQDWDDDDGDSEDAWELTDRR